MSNSVSVIFFEKVFLFLKNSVTSVTSVTSVVFIKKVSSHLVTFVTLSGAINWDARYFLVFEN